MDPISLIALATLAMGGVGAAGIMYRNVSTRERLRKAILSPISCRGGRILSIFDVFWDLDATEFTLELLDHRGLLLHDASDLSHVISSLQSTIDDHGGYDEFISDSLTAITEFRNTSRPMDHRHQLKAPERKLLLLPSGSHTAAKEIPLDRKTARSPTNRHPVLAEPSSSNHIDIDEVLATDTIDLIASFFSGGGGKKVNRWFKLRLARKRQGELDTSLAALFDVYVHVLRSQPDGFSHLFYQGKQWDAELTRIEALSTTRSWRKEPWAGCADVLMAEAKRLSQSLAKSTREETTTTLKKIDSLAAKGKRAMAGYLVYANRYAFFAGKLGQCEEAVRDVETATHKLREELRSCRAKGLI